MRSVTGIVTILPFPVLISAWGACPLPNPATEAAAIPQKQFPNLQNETGAVLEESNFVPSAKRVQDKPSAHAGPAVIMLSGEM
jgi:hypothetical protein